MIITFLYWSTKTFIQLNNPPQYKFVIRERTFGRWFTIDLFLQFVTVWGFSNLRKTVIKLIFGRYLFWTVSPLSDYYLKTDKLLRFSEGSAGRIAFKVNISHRLVHKLLWTENIFSTHSPHFVKLQPAAPTAQRTSTLSVRLVFVKYPFNEQQASENWLYKLSAVWTDIVY